MRKILLVLGLVVAFTGLGFANLPMQFSGANITYFGDSLSDMGNNTATTSNVCLGVAAPVTNHTGGAYPDKTWADMNQFGFYATPSNHPVNTGVNGIDYAYSGATVSPNVQICSLAATAESTADKSGWSCIPSQHSIWVNQLEPIINAKVNYGPNHLVVIWGGANDILDTFLESVAKGWTLQQTAAQLQVVVAQDMAYYTGAIIKMYFYNGVRNFLFIGMPNLSETPLAADNNVSIQYLTGVMNTPVLKQALVQSSVSWNNALVSQVLEPAMRNRILPGLHIYYFNPFYFMNNIIANPSAYGFSNTNQATWCVNQNDNPDTYMFFNYIHPTTALHAIIASHIRNAAIACSGSSCGTWS